eukprot:COSAG06_NODE_21306_length_761_cov_2.197885_2_plen_33_part_01
MHTYLGIYDTSSACGVVSEPLAYSRTKITQMIV